MNIKKNTEFSIAELAKVISGKIIIDSPRQIKTNQVSTDTRTDSKDKIFFCFNGKKHNPHNFISEIIHKKVPCIVISEEIPQKCILELKDKKIGLIRVRDTIIAHFALALRHFGQHKKNIQSLAITGSVGKTNVCQVTGTIMQSYYPDAIVFTYQNTNNIIGIAKNLFRINKKTRWVILEIGTNSKNEIPFISQHMHFDFTYINNIYDCHLGNFGSFDELKEEKLSIINKQKNKNAIHFLPSEIFSLYQKSIQVDKKSIINIDEVVEVKILQQTLFGSKFTAKWNDKEKSPTIKTQLLSEEHIQNFRLAFALD